jgi:hypothetical protein
MRAKIFHIVLLVAGIVLPIIAAFQDAANELGKLGKAGIVAAGVISAFTTVSHAWKPPMSALAKRIFAIIGTCAGIASPILAAVYTTLPTGAKSILFVGTATALVGSLKTAFGPMGVPPADLLAEVTETPPGGGEKTSGTS